MTLLQIILSLVPSLLVFFLMQAQINDLNEKLHRMTRVF